MPIAPIGLIHGEGSASTAFNLSLMSAARSRIREHAAAWPPAPSPMRKYFSEFGGDLYGVVNGVHA
jgi:hypothetical protein